VRPFFVVSTSECCVAGAGKPEHCLELPVQSESSLLEHAKRAKYDAMEKQTKNRCKRESYDAKRRKKVWSETATFVQNQIEYNWHTGMITTNAK
jgi:hypothetical protein